MSRSSAADYAQRMCPTVTNSGYLTGAQQAVKATAGLCSNVGNDKSTLLNGQTLGEGIFNSMVNDNTALGAPIATTTPSLGGSVGWVVDGAGLLGGGTSLPATPWTVSAHLVTTSGLIPTGTIRTRIWKITAAAGAITASTPLTPWSVAGATVPIPKVGGVVVTTTVTPTSTGLGPNDHLYVELALDTSAPGNSGAQVALWVNDANTYVDFGGAPFDVTPTPTNLRDSTDGMNAAGWVRTTTPTFRADLVDPDWYAHNQFQVCADTGCVTVQATGSSIFGEYIPSVNDSWTVPGGSALAQGIHYVRVRTQEDSGDVDVSPYTSLLTNTLCSSSPCAGTAVSKLGIDTGLPTGTVTAPVPVGGAANTVPGSGIDTVSGVASVTVTYVRTSPAAPVVSGTICASPALTNMGGGTYTWSCNWDVSALPDGNYQITVQVTDIAGNVSTTALCPGCVTTTYIDNTPPNALVFLDYLPGGGAAYQYWNGVSTELWVNSNQAGSFTTRFSASDGQSGVQKVVYPTLNGGATGLHGRSGQRHTEPGCTGSSRPGPACDDGVVPVHVGGHHRQPRHRDRDRVRLPQLHQHRPVQGHRRWLGSVGRINQPCQCATGFDDGARHLQPGRRRWRLRTRHVADRAQAGSAGQQYLWRVRRLDHSGKQPGGQPRERHRSWRWLLRVPHHVNRPCG